MFPPQIQRKKFIFLLLSFPICYFLWTLLHTKSTYELQTPAFDPISEPQTNTTQDNPSPSTIPFNETLPSTPPQSTHPKTPYCIAAFLGQDWHEEDGDDDDEDWYYVGARTLVYQLLHSPNTRLTEPITVLILVTKDVNESKRKRLEADGATLIEIEEVIPDFEIGEPRYQQVLTKLRAFDPDFLPYEKVLLMDTDMVITRPIDGIFQDKSSSSNIVNQSRIDSEFDVGPLPKTFTFAATPESYDEDHAYPYLDLNRTMGYFNSGLMLFSPSKMIYNFYLSMFTHPELFGHGWPEQDFLNFIHRLDGPMPWSRIHYSWYLNWPNENDFDGKMAILHTKYWAGDIEIRSPQLFMLHRRWEMQGYWIGKESASS